MKNKNFATLLLFVIFVLAAPAIAITSAATAAPENAAPDDFDRKILDDATVELQNASILKASGSDSHAHAWIYTGSSDTITASCTVDSCEYHTDGPNLRVTVSDTRYNGSPYNGAAVEKSTDWMQTGESVPAISYVGVSGTAYSESLTPPTNAGSYEAKITVNDAVAVAPFRINKADIILTNPVVHSSLTYTGGSQVMLATLATTNPSSGFTVQYKVEDASGSVVTDWSTDMPKATDSGTYKIYYKAAGTNPNYAVSAPDGDGSRYVEATIAPFNLGSPIITKFLYVDNKPQNTATYSGSVITADGKLTFNGVELEKGTDYTIGGDTERQNVGSYQMTLSAVPDSNFSGEARLDWYIERAPRPDKQVSSNVTIVGKTGKSIELAPYESGPMFGTPSAAGTVTMTGISLTGNTLTFNAPPASVGSTGTITIPVAPTENYLGYNIILTISYVAKTPVNISGLSSQTGLVYDGEAMVGVTGTPAYAPAGYTGTLEKTYEVETSPGAFVPTTELNSGAAATGGAPKYAGNYRVTVKIPDSDPGYIGSVTIDFTISKAIPSGLTVAMSDYKHNEVPAAPTINGEIKEGAVSTYYYGSDHTNAEDAVWDVNHPPALEIGTYYIYARFGETANYSSFATPKTDFKITEIALNSDDIGCEPVAVTYDGAEHRINVTLQGEASGAAISYSLTGEVYGLDNPSFKEASDTPYTVYYKITKEGYIPYHGKQTVTIAPKSLTQEMAEDITENLTYDGTAKEPTVTVKDGDTTLVLNTDYTVSYKDNINAGQATVTIVGMGNYSGSVDKSFTVSAQADPAPPTDGYEGYIPERTEDEENAGKAEDKEDRHAEAVAEDRNRKVDAATASKLLRSIASSNFTRLQPVVKKNTQTTLTLAWKAEAEADGYMIYGNKCNYGGKKYSMKLMKTVAADQLSQSMRSLEKGTYYKYQIVAYKLVDGQRVAIAKTPVIHTSTKGGKYGVVKSVRIDEIAGKKYDSEEGVAFSLAKGRTAEVKASEIKGNKPIRKHGGLTYETSDQSVATVSKAGRITAKKKGSCMIYVYAQNGVYNTINVTVE